MGWRGFPLSADTPAWMPSCGSWSPHQGTELFKPPLSSVPLSPPVRGDFRSLACSSSAPWWRQLPLLLLFHYSHRSVGVCCASLSFHHIWDAWRPLIWDGGAEDPISRSVFLHWGINWGLEKSYVTRSPRLLCFMFPESDCHILWHQAQKQNEHRALTNMFLQGRGTAAEAMARGRGGLLGFWWRSIFFTLWNSIQLYHYVVHFSVSLLYVIL